MKTSQEDKNNLREKSFDNSKSSNEKLNSFSLLSRKKKILQMDKVIPRREEKIKDIPILIIFVSTLTGSIFLSTFAAKRGHPYTYHVNYDSWGNICGVENDPIPKVNLSGRNQTSRRFAFQMGLTDFSNLNNLRQYSKSSYQPAVICVSECPSNITTCGNFLQENGYNFSSNDLFDANICVAPFGVILEHKPLLNLCVPQQVIQVRRMLLFFPKRRKLYCEITQEHTNKKRTRSWSGSSKRP